MRLLRNIIAILLALAAFAVGVLFVLANKNPVHLDLLVAHWQAGAGILLLGVLVAGLLIGLIAGLGLDGLLRLRRGGSS